jgi:hypothetical protein
VRGRGKGKDRMNDEEKLTKEEKEQRANWIISHEINHVKSTLIDLSYALARLKPGKAKSLNAIIGRLEDWQHRK